MIYHNQTNTQWTPEREKELRNLRIAGKSFSEIAAAMGTTRNVIAGKCRRLDLPLLLRQWQARRELPPAQRLVEHA